MPEPLSTLLSYKTFSPLFFVEISLVISLGFMGSPSSPATPIPCMHYVGGFFLIWESLYHGLTFQLCGVYSNSPSHFFCESKTKDCVFLHSSLAINTSDNIIT